MRGIEFPIILDSIYLSREQPSIVRRASINILRIILRKLDVENVQLHRHLEGRIFFSFAFFSTRYDPADLICFASKPNSLCVIGVLLSYNRHQELKWMSLNSVGKSTI